MTVKFLICALILFVLTMIFCLGIGLITKLGDKNEKYARYGYAFIIAFAFFGVASFFGTVFMAVFFIQEILG